MTSGHGEGCLFCVGLLAVLKGSPLPQSPTPTSGLLARVSTEFYLAGSHAWPLHRLSAFPPRLQGPSLLDSRSPVEVF